MKEDDLRKRKDVEITTAGETFKFNSYSEASIWIKDMEELDHKIKCVDVMLMKAEQNDRAFDWNQLQRYEFCIDHERAVFSVNELFRVIRARHRKNRYNSNDTVIPINLLRKMKRKEKDELYPMKILLNNGKKEISAWRIEMMQYESGFKGDSIPTHIFGRLKEDMK